MGKFISRILGTFWFRIFLLVSGSFVFVLLFLAIPPEQRIRERQTTDDISVSSPTSSHTPAATLQKENMRQRIFATIACFSPLIGIGLIIIVCPFFFYYDVGDWYGAGCILGLGGGLFIGALLGLVMGAFAPDVTGQLKSMMDIVLTFNKGILFLVLLAIIGIAREFSIRKK